MEIGRYKRGELVAKWDKILREKWYRQEKPDELVVNFFASLKKENKTLRIFDLGCGAGRNLVYMASQGFEAHGMDMSQTGLDLTRKRLEKRNLKAHVVKGDMHWLPYMNACFNVVICLFAIYHQKLEDIKVTISEIRRVLKKKGVLLVNFQSKNSQMYGKGIKIEEDTFIRQDGPEKGVPHHFTDKQEIMKLLKDFQTINIELHERTSADGYFQSRWAVVATA
ncbi:class I SAM-dependent methyltransferase [Candidatus Bathyarchaeota archaeon]|nr:class I SAM-dependent methyltransferase [Candidatus Bathyarchaeota archaeon]